MIHVKRTAKAWPALSTLAGRRRMRYSLSGKLSARRSVLLLNQTRGSNSCPRAKTSARSPQLLSKKPRTAPGSHGQVADRLAARNPFGGEKGGGAAAALMLLTWACWRGAYVHGVVATRGTHSEWTAGMPIDSNS